MTKRMRRTGLVVILLLLTTTQAFPRAGGGHGYSGGGGGFGGGGFSGSHPGGGGGDDGASLIWLLISHPILSLILVVGGVALYIYLHRAGTDLYQSNVISRGVALTSTKSHDTL